VITVLLKMVPESSGDGENLLVFSVKSLALKSLSLPRKAPADAPGEKVSLFAGTVAGAMNKAKEAAAGAKDAAADRAKLQPWRIVYIAFSVRAADQRRAHARGWQSLSCRWYCATR
jgi:hypothetical protein